MSPEQLNELVFTKPFQSFRLCMTDGEQYEVGHPDTIRIAGRTAIVLARKSEGHVPILYDHFHLVSLLHIVRVELLDPAVHHTNGG
jgi:hypothetical protein